ncbi:imidazole glycerol phosphate synthase subunit HisH [Synechococcus sp. A15-24]|uniref:imidazole glycerol phosphate synthase subunit HisH n=1 Tax=Synechococcus sp. A15-24 TaxID=1050635 RepID=UPI001647DE05|nr:imidazole glycerol phosphate synthase subunit HisH [Synechococcus sp. A15-24]QNJ28485.1 imidazole glycerol phosphate synthase/ HisH subunit [Synechococcus sp. A15-24]
MGLHLGLIDYGMGNLHSVEKAFNRLGHQPSRVVSPSDLDGCDALVLPGVGSFDPAIENLQSTGLIPDLKRWNEADRPLLGICLGLQLLFESSAEGRLEGLGLIKGHVERLPIEAGARIPHMGWAPLDLRRANPMLGAADPLAWVYFVHSYAAVPERPETQAAAASFGSSSVTAMVWKRRLGACQFHPEKSSDSGKAMLKRWLGWLQRGAPIG